MSKRNRKSDDPKEEAAAAMEGDDTAPVAKRPRKYANTKRYVNYQGDIYALNDKFLQSSAEPYAIPQRMLLHRKTCLADIAMLDHAECDTREKFFRANVDGQNGGTTVKNWQQAKADCGGSFASILLQDDADKYDKVSMYAFLHPRDGPPPKPLVKTGDKTAFTFHFKDKKREFVGEVDTWVSVH